MGVELREGCSGACHPSPVWSGMANIMESGRDMFRMTEPFR